ncbi:hypothetical protein GPY37_21200 [Photorhabdus kayaii]|uniref:Uncharacterized protein n=2 Tax=Photorhabdus TaxID=29487 RepID=A0ABX0B972_9GAMM|nr:hypothetical protein [Photorhabdus hainanensis]NDK99465.1 hypothetical protein [Photorhabdus bodei]NDL14113.1 hypothetical protein [Photorhabdus kayaii]NDL03793.1 hypothetical protein [Photorhabdus bodei]NDL07844.1 hypothetical protein [Photorhabdus bodei]
MKYPDQHVYHAGLYVVRGQTCDQYHLMSDQLQCHLQPIQTVHHRLQASIHTVWNVPKAKTFSLLFLIQVKEI